MRVAVLAVIALLLVLPAVAAAPVELTVEPAEQEQALNSHMRYWFTITNNQQRADTFTLETVGEHIEWTFLGYIAKHLEAGESFSAPLDFYTSGYWTGRFPFTLRAQSMSDSSVRAENAFTLTVTEKLVPGVSDLALGYRDGTLTIDYELSAPGTKAMTAAFTIRGPGGDVLKQVSTTKEASGRQRFQERVELGTLPQGTYSVSAVSEGKGTLDKFVVGAVEKLAVVTERIDSVLFEQVTVTVTNLGNAPARYVVVDAAAPGDLLTGNAIAGAACEGQRCTSTLVVEPGKSASMTYNVAHAVPFQFAAGLLALAAVGGFGYMHTNRPRISKRTVRHHAEKHSVILEVRNPRRQTENVVVRDHVSPLAHVIQEEFEAVKPVVNRTDAGTELIWKLGNMKPRETRMISYKVKPLVADPIKLGKARMHYNDKRGRRGVHHSAEATVAA